MEILYKRIKELCDDAKITGAKLCDSIGLSKGVLTDLKMGRKKTLSTESLSKISNYFEVPIDFFLDSQPFKYWEVIYQNRDTVFDKLGISPQAYREELETSYRTPLIAFIDFINMSVSAVECKDNHITSLYGKNRFSIFIQPPECTNNILKDKKKSTATSDDELWDTICSDKSKLMLARWISKLNQDQLQMVVKLLEAARLSPNE